MKTATCLLLFTAMLSGVLSAQGGDIEAGKARAASCVACHGAEGVSQNPMWPNLAGQQKGYLIKNMLAFRDGIRGDAMMTPMSKTLSDADIENLAEYYSSLCVCNNQVIQTSGGDSETE